MSAPVALDSNLYRKALRRMMKFMDIEQLYPPFGTAYLGVSGGLDSMVLLALFVGLKNKNKVNTIRAIHVNHGLRPESNDEELFVKKYCDKIGIDLKVCRLKMCVNTKNLEHVAREKRYEVFNSYMNNGDICYTAHHLDDSFEWFLLQQLRTASVKGALGIPVKNHNIARPLLKFTRKELEEIQKSSMIPFKEDISNNDERFERNYLRKNIIPLLKGRFPSCLQHFESRANSIENLLRGKTDVDFDTKKMNIVHTENFVSCYLEDFSREFTFHREELISLIKNLSCVKRGSLSRELDKLIIAIKNSKTGPMLFSGGVNCVIDGPFLHFFKSTTEISSTNLDSYGLDTSISLGKNRNDAVGKASAKFSKNKMAAPLVLVRSKKVVGTGNLDRFKKFIADQGMLHCGSNAEWVPVSIGNYVQHFDKYNPDRD